MTVPKDFILVDLMVLRYVLIQIYLLINDICRLLAPVVLFPLIKDSILEINLT